MKTVAYLLISPLSPVACFFVASVAFAGNNEMKDFRYRSCDRTMCIAVDSAKGWLSQATGAFVASGPRDQVKFQILKAGKVTKEFFGDEVVSQPEVHSMTIESQRSVVLVDVNTGEYEILSKSFGATSGGRR